MALSLNFTFGTPCSGGQHVPVTAALTGSISRSRTVTIERNDLLNAPTDDEVQAAVEVLLRAMIIQLSPKTNANIKTKIEAKTVDPTA